MNDFTKPKTGKRSPFGTILLLVGGIVLLSGLVYVAYGYYQNKAVEPNTNTATTNTATQKSLLPKPQTVLASTFATYTDYPVTVKPAVPSYTVAADLSNVTNVDQFSLSDAEKTMIAKNTFAVNGDARNDEYFSLYESNRYAYIPSFITTDSLLHNYHLYYDLLLKKVEQDKLIPAMQELNTAMQGAALNQYNTLKGTAWENAAKRNLAFFTVGGMLLDSAAVAPPAVQTEVAAELKNIATASGPSVSIVMNMGETSAKDFVPLLEDYSQYIPRGHYTESDALKSYFKTMMWYGRLTFRFTYGDETRSAALVAMALRDTATKKLWDKVAEPINFFVGNADDVTADQLTTLLTNSYGQSVSQNDLVSAMGSFATFWTAVKQFDPPKINSIPVFQGSLQPDRDTAITGFRFLGQRFTVDASIFQRLLCRDVGNQHGTMDCGGTIKDSRMLPNGLDIPAAMGSDLATTMLADLGQAKYLKYAENLSALKTYTSQLPKEQWSQNLYWGWMYALLPLTKTKYAGFPTFMQSDAWQKKELMTYLGSWSELKHDTILYSKQAYAEMGGGPPDEHDDRGYVEPNPQLFGRLASLIRMTKEGLDVRGLLADPYKEGLTRMQNLVLSLKAIAEKELENKALSADDYTLIRTYGGELEHFWLDVNKEKLDASGLDQTQYLMQNPAAIIADVATDPNGSVLEVGTGPVRTMNVVVPVDGTLRIARGAVYSYYEFKWPLSDRLTDEAWREKLSGDNPPKPAAWTSTFSASAQ